MFSCRLMGPIAALLAIAAPGWGQTYPLAEEVKPGDCFRVQLSMTLVGEMRVNREGKAVSLPLQASAGHVFPERILVVEKNGLPSKVARSYETAKANIKVESGTTERKLRPDRTLLVAQRHKDVPLVYSPTGALTREELEVCEHFDTLHLTGLLPGKEVAVGDTWKLPNAVVQAVCNFEGLTEQALTGKLESVKDGVATFSVSGTAKGIDVGALAKLEIAATGTFDLKAKRVASLEWKQKDEREQGPASPASVVQTTTTVKREVIEQPVSLGDPALVSVPEGFEVANPLVMLDFRDAKGRFELMHARDWQTVAVTERHLVLRLMDRGDFVAQATVAPWSSAGAGKHLSPLEFKAAMEQTPGWEPEKELQSSEVPAVDRSDKRWVYRMSVQGKLEGLPVLQNFYLIAAPSGEQVVVTFTLSPKQAEKLGTRDLTLVGSLEVPATPKK